MNFLGLEFFSQTFFPEDEEMTFVPLEYIIKFMFRLLCNYVYGVKKIKFLKAFPAFEAFTLNGWLISKTILIPCFLNCHKKLVIWTIDDNCSINKIEVKCQMFYEYLHVTS